MKKIKNIIFTSLVALSITMLFTSCEDTVNIKLKEGESQLVVDAMLTNDPAPQVIKLRKSANYFQNGLSPALGAEVVIKDLANRTLPFTDPDNDGNYEWAPNPNDFLYSRFGVPGNVYKLNIKYDGQEYESIAYMDSVPPIDSLYAEFQEQSIQGGDTLKAGYRLQMLAKDKVGEGNGYWFKSYRNGIFFNKPANMNLAYDAAFGPGSDGVQFIAPIVSALSPQRFQKGDTALIEIYSIGIPAVYFMNLAQVQMTNEGLFATPPVNVPTNVINKNKEGKKATGWFCCASVSRKGLRIK